MENELKCYTHWHRNELFLDEIFFNFLHRQLEIDLNLDIYALLEAFGRLVSDSKPFCL